MRSEAKACNHPTPLVVNLKTWRGHCTRPLLSKRPQQWHWIPTTLLSCLRRLSIHTRAQRQQTQHPLGRKQRHAHHHPTALARSQHERFLDTKSAHDFQCYNCRVPVREVGCFGGEGG